MKRKYINEEQLKHVVTNMIKEELNKSEVNESVVGDFIRNVASGLSGGEQNFRQQYQASQVLNNLNRFAKLGRALKESGILSSPRAQQAFDILMSYCFNVWEQYKNGGNINQTEQNKQSQQPVQKNQNQNNVSNSWPNNYSYDYEPQQNAQQGYSYNYEIPQQPQPQPKKNRYEDYYNNQFGESVAKRRINNLIREEMQNIMR